MVFCFGRMTIGDGKDHGAILARGSTDYDTHPNGMTTVTITKREACLERGDAANHLRLVLR